MTATTTDMADLRPLRVDVSPTLRKRVKVRAAEEELTMRQYIIEALERDLDAGDAEGEGHRKK